MKCQKCSGENTQTIKMACLSGTTRGSFTVVSISGLIVGVAAVDSKPQTNLVAMLHPGKKPGFGGFHIALTMICSGFMFLGLIEQYLQGLWGHYNDTWARNGNYRLIVASQREISKLVISAAEKDQTV